MELSKEKERLSSHRSVDMHDWSDDCELLEEVIQSLNLSNNTVSYVGDSNVQNQLYINSSQKFIASVKPIAEVNTSFDIKYYHFTIQ